jgi:hypothetical protein
MVAQRMQATLAVEAEVVHQRPAAMAAQVEAVTVVPDAPTTSLAQALITPAEVVAEATTTLPAVEAMAVAVQEAP